MPASSVVQHRTEVKKGERFEFGKNWHRFLSTLTDERIALAEESLRKFLGAQRLDGNTFLDIGSGSGLFSLAARRLGAKVRSFDYDPNSVACTSELRRRYFPDDPDWTVGQVSVLDGEFLRTLGTFDIVYSWGVLHHTGSMWQALDNVKPLARIGGQLFIAIYNDLGAVTDRWREIKQTYNRLPSIAQLPFALAIFTKHESRQILDCVKRNDFRAYISSWTNYARTSTRGMSKWHDWIDWIGGYPYECSDIEGIVDFYGKDGFELERLESRASGTGCNEFVFRRKADLGIFLDNPLPQSRFLLRQAGERVIGPFRKGQDGYVADIPDAFRAITPEHLILFRDGELSGLANAGAKPGAILVAPPEWSQETVNATRFELVRGAIRSLGPTLRHYNGYMYGASFLDLIALADNSTPKGNTSPVFVFEGCQQLGLPHSIHDDIVQHGAGRFAHWGQEILFSSSDNSDPRTNGRTYSLVIVEQ